MINELKEIFSETGPSRLFEIEMKIKKLEIENDDFKLYIDNLNSLCTEYNNMAKLQNKSKLSEEIKVLYSLEELNKVGIAYSFKFLYVEKDKNKNIKTVEIKEVYQHEDQINRVRNGKLQYNFNKEINSNEYCQYYHKNGHNTDNCFFNPSNSPNNNYRGEKKNNNNKSINKIKTKRVSLSRNGSKRNFKSYNVNYEEQNSSDSDSDPSFDFCFNITTNIVKDNFNRVQ
ncbi:hypothetical protein H8356DRAFT_1405121 [Neocallimastix lanati (nom. inval.)]|nr:hypothetical protein H8356DRAFT_1405121 [Neocallimastix sp. JGI-2020a]